MILYPKPSKAELMQRLVKQTQLMEIPHLTELPSNLRNEFSLVVDAVFGFSFKPPMREPFSEILEKVSKSGVPIFSVDIPSGFSPYFALCNLEFYF